METNQKSPSEVVTSGCLYSPKDKAKSNHFITFYDLDANHYQSLPLWPNTFIAHV